MAGPAVKVWGDYGPRDKRDHYYKISADLRNARSTYDQHWQAIADVINPARLRLYSSQRQRGDRKYLNIIDETGRFAVRTLQAGLHAGLTSPARPWFRLTTPDPSLAEYGAVKEWLHTVTQRMLAVLASSNIYNALPTVYGDIGTFGTGAMALLEDSKDLVRAYTYPLGSYALGVDDRNVVSSFARDYELTVRQVVRKFGVVEGTRDIDWTRISATVQRLWDQSNYEAPIPICWVVDHNPQYNPNKLEARFKRWSSAHLEVGEANEPKFLRESGFDSFPILAPRWDVTGEGAYGDDCPGMMALGGVRQLQAEQREKGKAIAKMVNPPLVGPSQLRNQKTSLLPGDVTYQDVREGMQGLRPIHEVSPNLEHMAKDIYEVQSRIERAFYVDLFLMLAYSDPRRGVQPPTATEVQERHEEKLLQLGPMLDRSKDELHDPLIDRVYEIMDRNGLIPPPPEEIQGTKLRVEYVSIMAQAQKLVSVVGQDRFVQTVGSMAQFFPAVLDKVDPDHLVDNYGDFYGIDPRIIVPTEVAQAARAERARVQQAAQAAEVAQMGARAAKDAADAGATAADSGTDLGQLLGR